MFVSDLDRKIAELAMDQLKIKGPWNKLTCSEIQSIKIRFNIIKPVYLLAYKEGETDNIKLTTKLLKNDSNRSGHKHEASK